MFRYGLALLAAMVVGFVIVYAQDDTVHEVFAAIETEPMASEGDSADDVAIWLHPTDPSLSTIIATNKRAGLVVYDLEGREIQTVFDDARLNNVDLRYNFPLGDERATIVVASNRRGDSLAIFRVDPDTRQVEEISTREIETEIDVYGLCLYHSAITGRFYAFVNGEGGEIQQWELADNGADKVDAELAREFAVESQPEGCVADDEHGYLYVGEEDVAIWRFDAEPDRPAEPVAIDRVGDEGHLEDDVEGLTVYYAADGAGYLIASSQGSDDYTVYTREETPQFLGRFEIGASETIDGATSTDGIDVTNVALNAAFPQGVFVAQDGRNTDPDANQNFKLVSWDEIAQALGLSSDTSWDPRAIEANAPAGEN